MRHKCICKDFGFHVPECFYSERTSGGGGRYHCIDCGGEPKWEIVEVVNSTMLDSGGTEQMCEVITRYCDAHRPKGAKKVTKP